ncbi:hypothetical protein MIR68_007407 [Amoeboaphelidium protococcarum]|nr:hypothetical protein MIR68_007407 [Amoeboaphelidium protococcarum]
MNLDWLASKTHEALSMVEHGAKNGIGQLKRVVQERELRDGERILSVLDMADSFIDKARDSLQGGSRQNDDNTLFSAGDLYSQHRQQNIIVNEEDIQLRQKQYEWETEALLQRFLYEQYRIDIDMPPVDVSYGSTDQIESDEQQSSEDLKIDYLQLLDELLSSLRINFDVNRSYLDSVLTVRNQVESEWMIKSPEQVGNNNNDPSELDTILHRIDKDIVRTDAGITMYRCDDSSNYLSNPRLRLMRLVLFSLALRHPEVGYVQGMSDLLSPFLYLVCIINTDSLKQRYNQIPSDDDDVEFAICFALIESFMFGPQSHDVKFISDGGNSVVDQSNVRELLFTRDIFSNYLTNQSGMNVRFNMLSHCIKWLDPVFAQHLTDLDSHDKFSTSNPNDNRAHQSNAQRSYTDSAQREQTQDDEAITARDVEDDWTELETSAVSNNNETNASDSSNAQQSSSSSGTKNILEEKMKNNRHGSKSFFWFFKSLLLLFKRDLRCEQVEIIGDKFTQSLREPHLDSVLILWKELIVFRSQKSVYGEIYMALAFIAFYVRPLIIHTYPLQKPKVMRQQYDLDEVNGTLDEINDRIWRQIIEGESPFYAALNQQYGMVTGEGSLEVLLRCMNAVSGKVSVQVLIRGMHYFHERLQCLTSQLTKAGVYIDNKSLAIELRARQQQIQEVKAGSASGSGSAATSPVSLQQPLSPLIQSQEMLDVQLSMVDVIQMLNICYNEATV